LIPTVELAVHLAVDDMGFVYDSSDPFSVLMAPPPGETPEERARREQEEADAQRVSDGIDDEIKKTRLALKKEKNMVKVLLLGQSESGPFHSTLSSPLLSD
jgi:guanine nucleotide-binding protein subunit alpha